jgi:GR25 family glycosyltransferase involved in LPS biosynthesis
MKHNDYIFMAFLVGIVIFFVIILRKTPSDKYKDIFRYSLMVHLHDHEPSQQRIYKVKQIYDEYEIPIQFMKATHWKYDKQELMSYPIDELSSHFKKRPGAYGLAGSLYKCLYKAYIQEWPYLLFLEDDAIPIPKNKDEFHNKLRYILNHLPDNGKNIYFLSTTIYCQKNVPKNSWLQKKDYKIGIAGGTSILFSKEFIHKIITKLKTSRIHKEIDHYLYQEAPDAWFWTGDISDNGMFCGLYSQIDCHCNQRESVMNEL